MSATSNIINIGADIKDFQVDFTNEDGTEADLSIYDSIELHVVDEFDNIYAKYILPYNNQIGYYPLELPFTSILQFNIHKEESQYFHTGDLNANVTFKITNAEYPEGGYQPQVNKILLGQVR